MNTFCKLWWVSLWLLSTFPAAAQTPLPLASTDAGLHRLAPTSAEHLRQWLSYSSQPLPVVSGHRGGAAAGWPENCLATFEATLAQTFALLEVDPRMTKDGVVVLHHDAGLQRTTTGQGLVADHTWSELQSLRLKDAAGQVTPYGLPTLDEALEWARGKTILVLDQKDVPLETRIQKISEHRAESYSLLIVGRLEDIQTCYRLNPNIMMEIFIGDRNKFEQFDQSGVPWSNVIAFVGHTPPQDKELLDLIHARGALCMAGTSRNLDRQFLQQPSLGLDRLRAEYRRLLQMEVDIIETDIPRELGPLLFAEQLPQWQLTPLVR